MRCVAERMRCAEKRMRCVGSTARAPLRSFDIVLGRHTWTRLAILLTALVLAATTQTGCMTRSVREVVWDDGHGKILLRSQKQGITTIARGFDHPVTIAPVRMTHILSRIDMRREEGRREPAIPTDLLYPLGEEINKALSLASPDQEVVVQAVRHSKRMGIFDRWYLTSLLLFVKDDLLYIQVSRIDWEIQPRRQDRLPEAHTGEYPQSHRLMPDKAMTLADHQTLAVEWKAPIFKKPTRTRRTVSGKLLRREVLMESLEDDTFFEPTPSITDPLTPEQLRALADLEEARRDGNVTEAEYTARKGQILRGELGRP